LQAWQRDASADAQSLEYAADANTGDAALIGDVREHGTWRCQGCGRAGNDTDVNCNYCGQSRILNGNRDSAVFATMPSPPVSPSRLYRSLPGAEQQQSLMEGVWRCPHCTFDNQAWLWRCGACTLPRPGSDSLPGSDFLGGGPGLEPRLIITDFAFDRRLQDNRTVARSRWKRCLFSIFGAVAGAVVGVSLGLWLSMRNNENTSNAKTADVVLGVVLLGLMGAAVARRQVDAVVGRSYHLRLQSC